MFYNHFGIIVCNEIGSNIAGIVFTNEKEPLYILTKDHFIINKYEKKKMTQAQIKRLEKIPSVGDYLEFNADKNGIIIKWAISNLYQEVFYGKNGVLQIKTQCVVSNEKTERRCWTRLFGFIKVEEKFTNFVIPNVAYVCRVNFNLNLDIAENIDVDTKIDLNKFKPQFSTSFFSFDGVEINEALIREAPWNRNLQLIINPELDIDPYDVVISTENHFKDLCISVNCLELDFNEIFCSVKPKEKILIAYLYTRYVSFGPGCQLICNMYFCRFNLCWIIYHYVRAKMARFPVDYQKDGTLILLVWVKEAADRPGFYYNDYTSYVADPYNLLNKTTKRKNKNILNCWNEDSNKNEKGYQVWVKKTNQSTQHLKIEDVTFIIDSVIKVQAPSF